MITLHTLEGTGSILYVLVVTCIGAGCATLLVDHALRALNLCNNRILITNHEIKPSKLYWTSTSYYTCTCSVRITIRYVEGWKRWRGRGSVNQYEACTLEILFKGVVAPKLYHANALVCHNKMVRVCVLAFFGLTFTHGCTLFYRMEIVSITSATTIDEHLTLSGCRVVKVSWEVLSAWSRVRHKSESHSSGSTHESSFST